MVGPAGSALTTIAGLKRDPPLTQLSDCRPSIIIMFFFFSFREEAPFLKAGTSGSPATLHVWELSASCPLSRCLLGPRLCLSPFCGHGMTGGRDRYVKRNASMSARSLQTQTLIYPGSCNSVEP